MSQKKVFNYTLSGFMLVALVFIIYSNTFKSPWLLDDYHNILDNPKIQISSLSLKSIKGSFFSSLATPEKLYRPLSCATFALNALSGGKDVFGYHCVNISLHAATSLILMWLLILVFRTPTFEKIPDKEKHFIVLLSTVLWAVNPIQIQAITYIVQRMAALCAFFSLMSLGFFLKARLSNSNKEKIFYAIFSAAGFTCAFFSKENGFTTLFLILALEYFLFRNGDYKILARKEFILVFLIFILLSACILFYSTNFSYLQELYEKRLFTLYDRLLTQPKVLLYYLSLIFYPLPQRLSLEHEIIISTGIFSPPQTFFYLIIVISSFCVCIFFKRIPLLIRLGIVFYFMAHSVESSILPLEIAFEHRNYLPSAFLFPPVAAGLYHLLDHFKHRKKHMRTMIIFFIIAIIFLTSLSTYSRNFDWHSGEAIWFDAMNKAPGHARPKQSMGFVIGMRNPERALNYYSKALTGYMHDPKEEKASTLANIGLIHYHLKNYKNARHFFKLAVETDETHQIAYNFHIKTYMKEGAWVKAIEMINKNRNPAAFARLKAACLLHTGDYNQSLDISRKIYRNNPKDQNALLNIAESLSMTGHHQRADFFYDIYISNHSEEPHVYLRKSKNNYVYGDLEKASELLSVFFQITGAEKAGNYFQKINTDIMFPIIGIEKMTAFFESEFEIFKKNIKLLS
ncbi:MAG: hypothetical protein HF978_15315 [Desulfobacteraceae bacterium]|nr:hypothetical protein [Desulfobacteraceae bacterium]MBC2756910.1 hypothetical protein [Desulfobacteraceae bacterium]